MRTPVPFAIDEQFVVLREIKAGGFGLVYAGWDENLDLPIALKEILPELLSQESALATFQAEAQLIARLDHPAICRLYTMKKWRGRIFMIMEYIDGGDVRQLMQRYKQLDRRLSPATLFYIITQIGHALHYAHMRVDPSTGTPLHLVHRDIAPSNIMISRMGAVKLIDFGIARVKGVLRPETLGGVIKGRPQYMSPEQVYAPDTLNHRSDIYSLAVVYLDMLTGHSVYGKTTHEYELIDRVKTRRFDLPGYLEEHGLPKELLDPLEHALELVPDKRTGTALEFIEGLGPYAKSIGFNSEMALLELRDAAQQTLPSSNLRDDIDRYRAAIQSAATMTIQLPQAVPPSGATSEVAPTYGRPLTPAPTTPGYASTTTTGTTPAVSQAPQSQTQPLAAKKTKVSLGIVLTLVLGALGFLVIAYYSSRPVVDTATPPEAVEQKSGQVQGNIGQDDSKLLAQDESKLNADSLMIARLQDSISTISKQSEAAAKGNAALPITESKRVDKYDEPAENRLNSARPGEANPPATRIAGNTSPGTSSNRPIDNTKPVDPPVQSQTGGDKSNVIDAGSILDKVGQLAGSKVTLEISGEGFKVTHDSTEVSKPANPPAPSTRQVQVPTARTDWTFSLKANSSASLFVDGAFISSLSAGIAFESSTLSSGSHQVRVEANGSSGCPLIKEFTTTVPANTVQQVDMTSGSLTVSGVVSPGAKARIISRSAGILISDQCSTRPLPIQGLRLLPGDYTLQILKDGRVIYTDQFKVNPYKDLEIELSG